MFCRTALSALILYTLAQNAPAPPRGSSRPDVQQLAGTYYEIARIPNRLQSLCASDVTTTYSVRPDGNIDVLNRCTKDDGTIAQIHGVGRKMPDGRVRVRFPAVRGWFGRRTWEAYWVLSTGPEYGYLLIGNESRNCLWILSRLPLMPQLAHRHALEIAGADGYDVGQLVPTAQDR